MPDRRVSPALYRYLPFAVFMGFIGLDEFIRFWPGRGSSRWMPLPCNTSTRSRP